MEKNNTDLLRLAVTQGKRTPLRAAEPASTDVPASDSFIPGSSATNKDLFIEREKPQANRPNGSFCSSSLRVTVAPEPQRAPKGAKQGVSQTGTEELREHKHRAEGGTRRTTGGRNMTRTLPQSESVSRRSLPLPAALQRSRDKRAPDETHQRFSRGTAAVEHTAAQTPAAGHRFRDN